MNLEEKISKILQYARFIKARAPLNDDWDDPEEWVIEGSQLAHDVIELIEHLQSEGIL